MKITISANNARVYQILNDIVAPNGYAIWTPIHLNTSVADRARTLLTNFWDIFPLDPPFERAVVARLSGLLPPAPPGKK